MKKIRSATTVIGLIGDGELAKELDAELTGTLAALYEHCGGRRKTKAKGRVTLVIDLVVEDGMVTMTPDITSKKPKKPRADGVFWVDDEGAISTEHPTQIRMNFEERARNGGAVVAPTTALA